MYFLCYRNPFTTPLFSHSFITRRDFHSLLAKMRAFVNVSPKSSYLLLHHFYITQITNL